MNVSQYSPNKKMEHEAIGPLDTMPLINELMREAGPPGQRRQTSKESFVRMGYVDVVGATLDYGIDEAGCAHVTGCRAAESEVVLPEEIDGRIVTAVDTRAFKGRKTLERIRFPETLRSIGRRAFEGTRLASLRIPKNLETVGPAAFYTGGATTRNYKPTIRTVEVDSGNKWFYIEEETLCQRSEHGNIALLYVGTSKRVVVPQSVAHIGAFAFMRADRIDQVVLHDGIKSIDVGGLDFAKGASALVYEVGLVGEELKRYVIYYPPGEVGRQTLRITLGHEGFDAASAYLECDMAVAHVRDTYTRSRMMLERLVNPEHLCKRMETLFRNRLATGVQVSVVEFGRNGYLEGIDQLLELGFLNEENIDSVIEAAIEADEVAAVSRLVEVKRTRFNAPLFDFDL